MAPRQTHVDYALLRLEYEATLRRVYSAIDVLDTEFEHRARTWAEREAKTQPCPSLELFVDHALLDEAELPGLSAVLEAAPRFVSYQEEHDPYGQIAILSRYSRVPVPGCYFSFDWHSEIAEREDELREIADDFYLCLRQLAPAIAEAIACEQLSSGLRPLAR
jgi:hypothetical protein